MALLIEGYGAQVGIDGIVAVDLAASLIAAFPAQVRLTVVDRVDDVGRRFTVAEEESVAVARCDGSIVARARDLAVLGHWLRPLIELSLAECASTGVFVHAGVVAWRNAAIVVPGTSHAGKSTLIAELVRCGAGYYSDEYAIVDSAGLVHPYLRPISLRDQGIPLRPEAGTEPLPISLVVATQYRPDAVWSPEILTGARAMLPLLDGVVVIEEQPERALQLAASLPPHLVTLQGERPEASHVAPLLLEHLDHVLGRTAQLTPRHAG
jgi:hypothetical protein